jgi:hypothetical protein
MRWLWQKTEPKKPWDFSPSTFIPRSQHFSQLLLIRIEVGNGLNTLFWRDRWLHGQRLDHLVPHLFGVFSVRERKKTVYDALTDRSWVFDIGGALTMVVLEEFLALWDLLSEVMLQPEVEDLHIW